MYADDPNPMPRRPRRPDARPAPRVDQPPHIGPTESRREPGRTDFRGPGQADPGHSGFGRRDEMPFSSGARYVPEPGRIGQGPGAGSGTVGGTASTAGLGAADRASMAAGPNAGAPPGADASARIAELERELVAARARADEAEAKATASQAQAAEAQAQLAEAQAQLAEGQAKAAEARSNYLRASAEMENVRRRGRRKRSPRRTSSPSRPSPRACCRCGTASKWR